VNPAIAQPAPVRRPINKRPRAARPDAARSTWAVVAAMVPRGRRDQPRPGEAKCDGDRTHHHENADRRHQLGEENPQPARLPRQQRRHCARAPLGADEAGTEDEPEQRDRDDRAHHDVPRVLGKGIARILVDLLVELVGRGAAEGACIRTAARLLRGLAPGDETGPRPELRRLRNCFGPGRRLRSGDVAARVDERHDAEDHHDPEADEEEVSEHPAGEEPPHLGVEETHHGRGSGGAAGPPGPGAGPRRRRGGPVRAGCEASSSCLSRWGPGSRGPPPVRRRGPGRPGHGVAGDGGRPGTPCEARQPRLPPQRHSTARIALSEQMAGK